MSEVHDGAEWRPEKGGDYRADTVNDHALGYRVRVACAIEGGRGRQWGSMVRPAYVSCTPPPDFSLPVRNSRVVGQRSKFNQCPRACRPRLSSSWISVGRLITRAFLPRTVPLAHNQIPLVLVNPPDQTVNQTPICSLSQSFKMRRTAGMIQ